MARTRSFQRHLRRQANPLDGTDVVGASASEQAPVSSKPVPNAAMPWAKRRPFSGYRFHLVGTLARALRHAPEAYGVTLDREGWADLTMLVEHLRLRARPRWKRLTETEVLELIAADPDERFECGDGRIRALYGHSIEGLTVGTIECPPAVLYHATSADLVANILRVGLRPMSRCHVHLTADRDYAHRLAEAKQEGWVLLAVAAREVSRMGMRLRRANRHVWLAESVPPLALRVVDGGTGAASPCLSAVGSPGSDSTGDGCLFLD